MQSFVPLFTQIKKTVLVFADITVTEIHDQWNLSNNIVISPVEYGTPKNYLNLVVTVVPEKTCCVCAYLLHLCPRDKQVVIKLYLCVYMFVKTPMIQKKFRAWGNVSRNKIS